ncbi:MAG TPA: DUF4214 domain-containing protein [Pyrinomonadaceae bacterium]
MDFYQTKSPFLVALLLVLSISTSGLPHSSLSNPMRAGLARTRPIMPLYSNATTAPGEASAEEQSAKLAIEYLGQVMDQFHNRLAVYDDVSSAGNHFFAWTKFQDGNAPVGINGSFTTNPHSGATAIQCVFSSTTGTQFGGFVFQNGTLKGTDPTPQPNFGTEPNAGIDLTGATALTFWARGKLGGEVVDFFMGGVGWNPNTGIVSNPCTPSFPGPCPHPDSTRAIKITKTLTSQWQQYRIELNGVPLNYVLGGFGWGVDGAKNITGAEFYLDDIQYELNSTRLAQRLNEPRFLRSFATLPFQIQPTPVEDFDLVLRNSAFTYDNAIALLAFLADGSADSIRRAKLIGDAFVYASQHDRAYEDGRLRSDYSAGDISLPPGWAPNGRPGTVPVPGFYDEAQQKFVEIEQEAVDTGNNTWAMIALLALYRQTSNPSYLATARNLGNFIRTFRNDAGTYQGFQGGLDNYPETAMVTRRTYASTEHNLDVYAAFTRMSQITGEPQWQADAQHARQFVEAMWNTQKRCYLAGTTDPDIRNQIVDQLPLDVQAWSVLALPDTLTLHSQVLECAEQNHRNTSDGFSGFDFNEDRDGVWFEGTAQMATAYAFAAQQASMAALRQELSRAQATAPFGNGGGVAAASHDGLTTGFNFKYFRRLHIGATAWNVFAQLGYNPFYQTTAPAIQLSSATRSASEGEGSAQIIVNRTDATAAAAVNYATSDTAGLNECNIINGIASSRCDYAATVGTLRFAAGESSKTIFIPLVDDSFAESNESFTIALSSPSGAILGSTNSAIVTITDNDPATGANPVDTNPFFVRQHYIDFLGREPDPVGYQGWQDILNNCQPGNITCDRIEVSSGFFRSEEFQSRGYFTYRFYSASLERNPRYAEFIPDMAKLSGFLSPSQLEANKVAFIQEFMTRTEFTSKYNSLTTSTAYVDGLLQTAGLPNHPTRGFWINGLTAGTLTRADVLRGLVDSAEVYNKFYTEAFVVMQYFGYLRRDPDILYLEWIKIMNQNGGDYRGMIHGFMNSAEYRQRFGP